MQINRNKIRGLMAENGDTQADLARKLGVTRTTINNYLNGVSPITLETANHIAEIYKVSPFELLQEK